MSESSLSAGFGDYRSAVGKKLGYGSSSANWSSDQSTEITDIVKAGLRRFYAAHDWRFLRPSTTLTTTADDAEQDLPDNFGFLVGPITYASSHGWGSVINIVPEQEIRAAQQRIQSYTGKPTMAAIRPKTTTGTTGQRYEIMWYPTPDATYTLHYQYHILPDTIDATFSYAYGGMRHVETIMEACLSVAEERMDDEIGVHNQRYQELLAASIRYDSQLTPTDFGYNGDTSEFRNVQMDRRARMSGTSYNGVEY